MKVRNMNWEVLMKKLIIAQFIMLLSVISSFGQTKTYLLPVIDMHLHVYTPDNYWGGNDVNFRDTILVSPATQPDHLDAVIRQIKKYYIVKTYASGNFKALDIINKSYPELFLPSREIWPTRELLKDTTFLNTLEEKIKSGEIHAIGEVANFYMGIAPNDPVMDALYSIAEKYDIPISLHFAPGPSGYQLTHYPDMRLEYADPYLLQDVLIKFPKLRLYMMHAGIPMFVEETFAMLFMFPKLYVDIATHCWYSDYTKEALDDFLIKAMRYGFGDRIMFGSDEMVWPGAIGLSIDYINNADFLTEKQKRDILYNNAAKFLRLTKDEINKHFQKSRLRK